MSLLNPNLFILIIEFMAKNSLINRIKELNNEFRVNADEMYNDLLPENEKREVKDHNILYLLYSGLIKKPIEVGTTIRKLKQGYKEIKLTQQPPIGVIMIYEFLGLPDHLEDFKNRFKKFLTVDCDVLFSQSSGTLSKIILGK